MLSPRDFFSSSSSSTKKPTVGWGTTSDAEAAMTSVPKVAKSCSVVRDEVTQ